MTYFIQARSGGPIKIGKTDGDPYERMAELQVGNPEPLVLLGTTRTTEESLHRRFRLYRLEGEWFVPGKRLLTYLKQLGIHASDTTSPQIRIAIQREWWNPKSETEPMDLEAMCGALNVGILSAKNVVTLARLLGSNRAKRAMKLDSMNEWISTAA